MKSIRAKFVCDRIEDLPTQEEKQIYLSAVVGDSEENKSFSRWTPSGNLDMIVSNETSAGDLFEVGQEYYLDIQKAVATDFDFEPVENLTEEEKADAEEIELTEEEKQKAAEIVKEGKPGKVGRFQFLAIIDGSIQRPVFDASDSGEAVKKFREKWPLSTIHECKEV